MTIEIAPQHLDLRVGPERSRIDQPLRLTVAGSAPGSAVTLSARTQDGAMVSWISTATFTADGQGTVDPARDVPVEGTYAGVDASGLLWSMHPAEAKGHRFFSRRRPILQPPPSHPAVGDDHGLGTRPPRGCGHSGAHVR